MYAAHYTYARIYCLGPQYLQKCLSLLIAKYVAMHTDSLFLSSCIYPEVILPAASTSMMSQNLMKCGSMETNTNTTW